MKGINNMNIQEAVKQALKTGKQFYRKSEGDQLTFEVSKSNRCIDIDRNGERISGWWNPRDNDLMANDWKIKE